MKATGGNLVFRWTIAAVALFLVLMALVAYVWREEILRTALDPKQPFQTYTPPPAPDYGRRGAWAILPADPGHAAPSDPPVDVFFVHPTTYDGGKDWNGPIGDPRSNRFLERVALPNYAGPFARVGRVFAPRYRQASLYSFLTLRDDAREARRFAYRDVRAAFEAYLRDDNDGRPLVLAGAGQGAKLLSRLVQEVVAPDPALARRIAGVYLIDSLVPAARFGPSAGLPACSRRDQARCVLAWFPVRAGDGAAGRRALNRALVWTAAGQLENLGGQPALCVNPLTGGDSAVEATAKLNLGAANATGVEWGVRPAFMPHQVSARCEGGLLWVSRPASASLQPAGSWADRRKVAPYNLFYADIEADAEARVETLLGRPVYGPAAPPIDRSTAIGPAPVHRID